MSKITLNPYIFFRGNCQEAMEFYQNIFGGKLQKQTYEETPGETPQGMEGKLMHAILEADDIVLMGSDTQQASDKAAKVSLSINGYEADAAKLTTIFDKLSEDVEVLYPLKKEFWGDTFGVVTDKYGIEWMVNISSQSE